MSDEDPDNPPKKPEWDKVKWYHSDAEQKEEREGPWVKWTIITVLSVVGAAIIECVVAFYPYYMAYGAKRYSTRRLGQQEVQTDTVGAMKTRFFIGAGIGGVVSFFWMVRVLSDKDEPR